MAVTYSCCSLLCTKRLSLPIQLSKTHHIHTQTHTQNSKAFQNGYTQHCTSGDIIAPEDPVRIVCSVSYEFEEECLEFSDAPIFFQFYSYFTLLHSNIAHQVSWPYSKKKGIDNAWNINTSNMCHSQLVCGTIPMKIV